MKAIKINAEIDHEFERVWRSIWEGLKEGKGREKCNYVIILKIKLKNAVILRCKIACYYIILKLIHERLF